MAFDAAFKAMGSKTGPGGKDFTTKGKEKTTPAGKVGGESGEVGEEGLSLHSNGDGTFHSSDGEQHPDMHHAVAHFMNHHEPGAKHFVASHDGLSHTSHGIHESGEHDGPHDAENIEQVKDHLGKFFDEEEHEGDGGEDGAQDDAQHGGW